MQLLNKITIKAVCGDLENAVTQEKPTLNICQVIGVVKDKEKITGQYGDSYKLKGEFKAVNLITKEQFYSANCFLPGLANDLVVNQIDSTGDNAVQFAFVIGIKFAKNKVGYEYSVQPLIKPAENNALNLIENQIKTSNPDGITSPEDIQHQV